MHKGRRGYLMVENPSGTALQHDDLFTITFGKGVFFPGCAYGLDHGKGYRIFTVPPIPRKILNPKKCLLCANKLRHPKAMAPKKGDPRPRVGAEAGRTRDAVWNQIPDALSEHLARVLLQMWRVLGVA